MARQRDIAPGFFRNEDLGECSPLARLLFAGLWCWADRLGRLEDRPRRLRAEILPYDDADGEALIAELAAHGFLRRYESDGLKVIQIVNFEKYQKPHPREAPSILPDESGIRESNAQGEPKADPGPTQGEPKEEPSPASFLALSLSSSPEQQRSPARETGRRLDGKTDAEEHPATARLIGWLAEHGVEATYARKAADRAAVEAALLATTLEVAGPAVAEAIRATGKPWLGWHLDTLRAARPAKPDPAADTSWLEALPEERRPAAAAEWAETTARLKACAWPEHLNRLLSEARRGIEARHGAAAGTGGSR